MNPASLVVAARREPQLNGRAPDRQFLRKEKAAIEFGAVRSDNVDLAGLVQAVDQPVATAPAPPSPDRDDVSLPDGPFALHAEQPGADIEDEVVPLVAER